VVVLEAAGRLGDAVEDLDLAIQQALASGPRGVACDLSAVLGQADPRELETLATVGRHVRDWQGIPVAVANADAQVRDALSDHPLGGELIVTKSMLSALYAVLRTPAPTVEWLRLTPQPTAPRASRDFVSRTLVTWGLSRVIPTACLVVSELVTNATVYAGSDIDVSIAWHRQALRLTVRDRSPVLPREQHPGLDLHGRGLTIVAGVSRAFGVLPTADGGKVVWAVLDAPRPSPPTTRTSFHKAAATEEPHRPTLTATLSFLTGNPLPENPGEAQVSTRHGGAVRNAPGTRTSAPRPFAVSGVGRAQGSHHRPFQDSPNYLG